MGLTKTSTYYAAARKCFAGIDGNKLLAEAERDAQRLLIWPWILRGVTSESMNRARAQLSKELRP